MGEMYSQRMPRLKVRLRRAFQSSWKKSGVAPVAMSPLAGDGAAALGWRAVEQEIAEVDAGVAAGIGEEAESAVVAGIVVVLLRRGRLAAELQEVGSGLVGEMGLRLVVVLPGIGDAGAGADARQAAAQVDAAQAGDGLAAGDAELGVAVSAEHARPVESLVVDADAAVRDAGFVDQAGV